VDRVKRRGTELHDHADQVHGCLRTIEQRGERIAIIQPTLYEGHSLGLEEFRPAPIPHQGADAVTTAQELCSDVPAHKPSGTGNGD
jgi:hypothetical protein